MNKELIIQMAREAGLEFNQTLCEFSTPFCDGAGLEELERFFQLATEWERKRTRNAMKRAFRRLIGFVRADEREACAKICDTTPPEPFRPSIEAAHAIRARGETNNG